MRHLGYIIGFLVTSGLICLFLALGGGPEWLFLCAAGGILVGAVLFGVAIRRLSWQLQGIRTDVESRLQNQLEESRHDASAPPKDKQE